jgi:putative DNA primase/helicase
LDLAADLAGDDLELELAVDLDPAGRRGGAAHRSRRLTGPTPSSCKSIGWGWAELREKYDGPSDNSSGPGPRELAARYVAEHATHADGVALRRWRGDWWRWSADRGCYMEQTEDQIIVALYRALRLEKRSDVADVQAAIMAEDRVLIDGAELGTWLDGPPPPGVGALDTVACRNGMVHLPMGKLTPTTPRYFTTTALPLDYDEDAPIPKRWLDFLRQLWPEDEASIAFLQEWIGYLLTPDTRQHKIAYLIGKPRSGKGTIGRVITALLGGKANVAAPTLAQFATNFGIWPLVGKLAAIVGDARLSGRSDVALVVERLLSISGEDPQNFDRKHRDAWNWILPTRITIISNEIPRFVDASPALAERSIMLSLKRSFLGEEDTELTEKLVEELPGILMWAIEGWRRLRERRRFNPPESSKRMVRQMADLASPVGGWVRARCETGSQDPDNWIRCEDAYADFKTWCGSNGHQHVPSLVMFGRDIQTVTGCERKRLSSKFPNGPRPWVYEGLSMKTEDAEDAEDAA